MINNESYRAKEFNLSGLNGISDRTLEMHFKLYEGYVSNTNTLNEKIAEILFDGHVDQEEMPAYSELTRRLGFEYNGMVLHEYYFENMKRGGSGDADKASAFFQSAEQSFGSYDIWKADFVGIGKMRGDGLLRVARDLCSQVFDLILESGDEPHNGFKSLVVKPADGRVAEDGSL